MASLDIYVPVLGLRKAKHLLRRATFNFSKININAVASMTASEALDFLSVNTDYKISEPQDPKADGFWTSSNENPSSFSFQGRKRNYIGAWWWYNGIKEITIKHKLSFFLFTSFTASKNGSGASTFHFDYLRLLDFYAMGNIKTFAKKVTLDNAMLDYLDNTNNNANNPNENYAREFLELFTILKGPQIGAGNYTNYTEIDVQQAARVLTGFKKKIDRSIIDPDTNLPKGENRQNKHDSGDKIFSSAFGNQTIIGRSTQNGMDQELDDFVDMIFSQEETAKAYCRKLYRYFVKSEWDSTVENDIITPLAQQLISNNFEILPVVTTLLTSKHFYDEDDSDNTNQIIGSIVKSPLQLTNEVITLFNVNLPNPNTSALDYYHNFFNRFMSNTFLPRSGMSFFDPDSVAGYPAHYQEPDFDRLWFSSNTIISRYKFVESLIKGKNTIAPNADIKVVLDTVLFVENNIEDPYNITSLVTEISKLMYPEDIDTDRINYFASIALDGFPDFYWTSAWTEYINSGDDNVVRVRLNALITSMVNATEFQLM